MMFSAQLYQNIVTWLSETGIRILIALSSLFVSFHTVNRIAKKLEKRIPTKKKADQTLARTLLPAGKITAKILILLCLFSYLGIDTGSITAFIASLGIGIGLAVNGALSNLAGGILLLVNRPFQDGDYITVGEISGTAEEIRLLDTRLRTVDNRIIYYPNGELSSAQIINETEKPRRRVDITFSIGNAENIERAKAALLALLCTKPEILPDPPPEVKITEEEKSSVPLTARAWVKTDDYWDVYFSLLEEGKSTLRKAGIVFSYQQIYLLSDRENPSE